MNLTAQIELRICKNERSKGRYAIQNVYAYDWESDVFSMTKNNRVTEFEVKISRSDFLADKKKERYKILQNGGPGYIKKSRTIYQQQNGTYEKVKVTDSLYRSDMPNYFYYVCPTGIINPDEIPACCGLIYCDEHTMIREIKKPKRLHNEPFNKIRLFDKLYYRVVDREITIRQLHERLLLLESSAENE